MSEHPIHLLRDAATFDRREALALMAASVALATSACSAPPEERIRAAVNLPEASGGGQPAYYASAWLRDGFAHGVLVGTQQGRPIKIEGNPSHPASLGATDVFTQASVLQLWDPDRSASVGQRLGTPQRTGGPVEFAVSSWGAFEAAWRTHAERLVAKAGTGLRVLTGPITSPTERALLAALHERFPRARWHVHAPLREASAAEGARLAFGRELATVRRFDRAACVLSLAADPFSDGPAAVRQALDWSQQRALRRDTGNAARLLAVEAVPGLFGARADVRVALPPAEIEAMLWRIASRWLPLAATPGDAPHPAEAQIVRELRHAGPDALIVAGRDLSAQAHALVHALHQRMGAIGRTLDLIEPPDGAADAGPITELVDALHGGAVDTLLMLGVNPAYDAPGTLGFSEAMAKAGASIHAGLHADETATLSDWHLPLSHDYERWGDALAFDGTATLLQPAIAPLYDSRSMVELLALLAGSTERGGYALLRRQWLGGRSAGDAEGFWRGALRRGFVEGSAFAPVSVPRATLPMAPTAPRPGDDLVLLFTADPSVHDGQFANNGWLQELPRPFSKLTWDNALQLGPRTAQRHGVAHGDMAHLQAGGRSLDAPVWVSDRQAEGVAALPLGYGRRRAGRVGNGVGVDAYLLRPLHGGPVAASLRSAGTRYDFAVTQHEFGQSGRELARTVAAGQPLPQADTALPSVYPPRKAAEHAWAMTIDLDACIGCNACTIACQAENNIPVVGKEQVAKGREMHWIRVDRYDAPEIGNTVFQPVPCMHCENAPCELVCPVGATVHDSDGLNLQVYHRCIGTRFCSNNCPYKVRRFNFLQFTDETSETLKAQRNPSVTVRQRGVMEKCSYCLQRISRARQQADRSGAPLADGDVVTACQAVCPTRAIHFGDLHDPKSDIVRTNASPRRYALLGELNTRPRTTYLARVAPPTDTSR